MNKKNKLIVLIINSICLILSIIWFLNSETNLEPLILIASFIGALIITLNYSSKDQSSSIKNEATIRGDNNNVNQHSINSNRDKTNNLTIDGNKNTSTQLNK